MLHRNIRKLLSASLLVLSGSILGSSQGNQPTIKYTASRGENVICLGEVNTAREAAGLPNFGEASGDGQLSDPGTSELQPDTEWRKLCEYLIPTQTEPAKAASAAKPFEQGIYAFKSLTTAEPNCKEAVDYWKSAFKNFSGLPPSKSQAGQLYNSQDNVSFVALYNPSSDATADCRVITCTKTTTTGGSEQQSDPQESKEYGYGMICKTIPTAFTNNDSVPFTQDQWDRIISSLTGSASVAIPGFGVFLLAVFSLTAL
ncbi:SAG family member (sag5) [Eimeria tenella]|uniref:SAG family member (Sag5) n=1 Tax=Eimeria tenella TaxID=5802 RepID=Q70CE2_EIMTE|nr:SAG family member (sag5) [Eimeria tenella]CAE52293.1 surface antigen 5 [Eimeria tenella]CDJ40606.1 SAG family member (sag5) [Eimeria tenella]|eukprot:XP_013231356.1 SAG family member (sag5) [Eimeria tenella]